MIKGKKWVMGGTEIWHLFFYIKKALTKTITFANQASKPSGTSKSIQ
jgi:hypothetical protein